MTGQLSQYKMDVIRLISKYIKLKSRKQNFSFLGFSKDFIKALFKKSLKKEAKFLKEF